MNKKVKMKKNKKLNQDIISNIKLTKINNRIKIVIENKVQINMIIKSHLPIIASIIAIKKKNLDIKKVKSLKELQIL